MSRFPNHAGIPAIVLAKRKIQTRAAASNGGEISSNRKFPRTKPDPRSPRLLDAQPRGRPTSSNRPGWAEIFHHSVGHYPAIAFSIFRTTVKRYLFSPGKGADPSRRESLASEHGAPSLLTGLGFSPIKLGKQPVGSFNPGRNGRRI